MAVFEVEGLEKRYRRTAALRGVSFAVEAGAIHGLLGPNGAGKTSTLACALGFVRPSAGRARVLGMTPRHLARSRGRVGVVSDRPALLPGLTARQNLRYVQDFLPRGARGARGIDAALELTDAAALARRRAGQLSLGQRKRVAIAGALLGRPELLVLDEPLSGLDPGAVAGMLALLRRLAADGTTLVLSSHRLHEMQRVVSHAVFLYEGRVARAGTLGELLGAADAVLRVGATPRERVLGVFRALDLAVSEDGDAGAETTWRVRGACAARLARALVEAGCDLAQLTPERRDLQAVFDEACGGLPGDDVGGDRRGGA